MQKIRIPRSFRRPSVRRFLYLGGLILVGLILGGRNAPSPAEAMTREQIQAHVDRAGALVSSARQLEEAERKTRYIEAIELLEGVLREHPPLLGVRIYLGRIRFLQGDLIGAAQEAQRALDLDPRNRKAQELIEQVQESVVRTASRTGSPRPSGSGAPAPGRLMKIPGQKLSTPSEHLDPEEHTLFLFTTTTRRDGNWGAYVPHCCQRGRYSLRIIELARDRGPPDFDLPVARAAGVDSIPYLILYDPEGEEVARGRPADVQSALAELEKRHQARARERRGKIRGEDLSWQSLDPRSFVSQTGLTVMMLTSAACRSCPGDELEFFELADSGKVAKTVFGDVGVDERDDINWDAPVFQELGIYALPYYLVFDSEGSLVNHGEVGVIRQWTRPDR